MANSCACWRHDPQVDIELDESEGFILLVPIPVLDIVSWLTKNGVLSARFVTVSKGPLPLETFAKLALKSQNAVFCKPAYIVQNRYSRYRH